VSDTPNAKPNNLPDLAFPLAHPIPIAIGVAAKSTERQAGEQTLQGTIAPFGWPGLQGALPRNIKQGQSCELTPGLKQLAMSSG
jgi:hypothetical protein